MDGWACAGSGAAQRLEALTEDCFRAGAWDLVNSASEAWPTTPCPSSLLLTLPPCSPPCLPAPHLASLRRHAAPPSPPGCQPGGGGQGGDEGRRQALLCGLPRGPGARVPHDFKVSGLLLPSRAAAGACCRLLGRRRCCAVLWGGWRLPPPPPPVCAICWPESEYVYPGPPILLAMPSSLQNCAAAGAARVRRSARRCSRSESTCRQGSPCSRVLLVHALACHAMPCLACDNHECMHS